MKISAKKIKHLMCVNLLTQAELADKSGLTRNTITATLARGSCSTSTAGKIAKALGIEPIDIIEEE